MKKPSLKDFILFYISIWIAIDIFLSQQTPDPFVGAIFGNLIMVAINVVGGCVMIITDWAPWRDTE